MNMLASRGQLRASFIRWALFFVPLCVVLGAAAGMVGPGPETAWFQGLVKPDIYPEPKWFGIVWTILYVLIGLATALVAASWGARGRGLALGIFVLHFAINLSWTPVFFGLQQMSVALAVIVAMALTLLLLIVLYWRVRKLAAILLLPYLAWVCFAGVLNFEFLKLNPGADGGRSADAVERVRIGN